MFSLFNFSSIFQAGQLTPFAPMCGRPWLTPVEANHQISSRSFWHVARSIRTDHKLRIAINHCVVSIAYFDRPVIAEDLGRRLSNT